MKRGFASAFAGITAAVLVFGAANAQQKAIAIGTGGTGGVYYPIGGALANLISKNLPNVQATAQVTGGSVDNLKLINAGQSEIGFSMADAALDALNGVDKFKGTKVPLRTLMVLYPTSCNWGPSRAPGATPSPISRARAIRPARPARPTEVRPSRSSGPPGSARAKD